MTTIHLAACSQIAAVLAGYIFPDMPLISAPGVLDESRDAPSKQLAADYSTPKKTFEAFLLDVKANDLAAAKKCWFISDDDKSGALDIFVGDWIATRRFQQSVRSKFGNQGWKLLDEKGLIWESLTDQALDETMARLKNADVEIHGDTAKLRVWWGEDQSTQRGPIFLDWGSRPLAKFRRVNGAWKLDGNWQIGFQRPGDFFEPDGWFYFYPGGVALLNQVSADINSGKFETAPQAVEAFDKQWKALFDKVQAEKKKRHLDPIEACFFSAWKISLRFTREFYVGRSSLWGICTWSRRLMQAEISRHPDRAERILAAEAHLDRIDDVRHEIRERAALGREAVSSYFEVDVEFAEAKILLAAVKSDRVAKETPLAAATARLAAAQFTHYFWWQRVEQEHLAKPSPDRTRLIPLEAASRWSRRWLDAEMAILRPGRFRCGQRKSRRAMPEANSPPQDQVAAAKAYHERTRQVEEIARKEFKAGLLERQAVLEATFYREDAEALVADLKAGTNKSPIVVPEKAKDRLETAKAIYDGVWKIFLTGRSSAEVVYEWSCRWRNLALRAAMRPAERVSAAESHLGRMKKLQKVAKEQADAGNWPIFESWASDFFVAEAERLLADAKSK
jgi:hypothetical protein